jgi:hypothetical protein
VGFESYAVNYVGKDIAERGKKKKEQVCRPVVRFMNLIYLFWHFQSNVCRPENILLPEDELNNLRTKHGVSVCNDLC